MNNLFFMLLLFVFSNGLFAQEANFKKNSKNTKSEIYSPRLHSLGISVTSFGPLELNYQYQLSDKLRFRVSVTPLSFKEMDFEAHLGFRYTLLSKGKFDLYTGIDYSYLRFDLTRFNQEGDLERNKFEIPLGVLYNFNERSAIDLSVSAGYTINETRNKLPTSNSNSFNPLSRIRIGYQYKF